MSYQVNLLKASHSISKILIGNMVEPIPKVLEIMGKTTKASHTYIFEISPDQEYFSLLYKYINESFSQNFPEVLQNEKDLRQKIKVDLYLDFIDHLMNKELILDTDTEHSTLFPLIKPLLFDLQIKSLVILPLNIGDKLNGFIGLSDVSKPRKWTENEIEFLQMNTELIGRYFEAKKLAKELQKSEKRYRELFERAPIGIFLTNSDGRALAANQEMARIVGAKNPEQALKNFQNLSRDLYVNPNKRIEFLNLIKENGYVDNFIYKAKNINGDVFWLNTNARIINPLPDGSFQMDGFSIDITKQKNAEKNLIEQERLRAIGEFASSVAHDFNNTLQGILGNIELIQFEKNIPDVITEPITTIKKLALDAASRISQLQRFTGKSTQSPNYQTININKIVDDSITQTRHLWRDYAHKNGISISIQKKLGKFTTFWGNEGEIRSVLFNIIKNSIQAMPMGGKITFKTYVKDSKTHLQISDTGVGMSEETKKRVFQPFYTTKGFTQGIGLGLSGAYSIIEEHNAEISILRSEIGKGTTIELIFHQKNMDDTQFQLKTENVSLNSTRILWVEDEPYIRDVIEKLMKNYFYNIDVVNSAKKGLELYKKMKYDIIITDLGMPEMNGWQFVEIIRSYDSNLPIILVTGWGNEISKDTCVQHKIDFTLSKPIKIKQLIRIIEKIVPANSS